MSALQWLQQPASRLVTASLLHFLWQGLAIGLALIVLVELCKVRQATTRYACSLTALIAMIVCPLATLAWLSLDRPPAAVPAEALEFKMPFSSGGVMQRLGWLDAAQPFALAAWLIGVTLFSSRLLAGFVGISRLRRGRLPLPPKMASLVERLGRRLAIDALPLVYLNKQVADAMAVGLVRPLVLIPASWATEMPLPMLEAVIAHELAHLARRDLWVNLLQRIVETMLFYHPVVWWLSRRLRIERELCADELAVMATGKRLEYAQALEQIAGERQADIRPALAAFLRGETDMRLLQRVRNVLNQPTDERSRLWPAGMIALALPLGLWVAAAMNGVAIADDDEPKKTIVKRDRGNDVKETRIELRRERAGDGDRRRVEIEEEVKGGDKDTKTEERVERYVIRKPGQPPQEVERKIVMRDGKPVTVEILGIEDAGVSGDRRLDELTALVKKLAGQVERLQDEVKQLRGGRIEGKQSINVPAMGPAPLAFDFQNKFEAEERSQLDARKRERQLTTEQIEAVKRALNEKEMAMKRELGARQDAQAKAPAIKKETERATIENKLAIERLEAHVRSVTQNKLELARIELEQAGRAKEQAAREKAREGGEKKERVLKDIQRAKELKEEAARDKSSEEGKLLEKKLKSIKERKEPTAQEEIDAEQLEVELRRNERDRQSLLK